MSTYKRESLLGYAIDSILNQTFSNFELIIMDDGSKDRTREIIESYMQRDSRIRCFRSEVNCGLPAIRYNQGMSLAKGDYFAFMFDDDEWYPNALDTLYSFILENKECGMVYGLADFFQKTGCTPGFGGDWDYEKLVKQGNFICNLSVLLKREVINDVGGYDESLALKRLCDWDLWVRVGEKYPVKKVNAVVGRVLEGCSDSIAKTTPLSWVNIEKHLVTRDAKLPLMGLLPLMK